MRDLETRRVNRCVWAQDGANSEAPVGIDGGRSFKVGREEYGSGALPPVGPRSKAPGGRSGAKLSGRAPSGAQKQSPWRKVCGAKSREANDTFLRNYAISSQS